MLKFRLVIDKKLYCADCRYIIEHLVNHTHRNSTLGKIMTKKVVRIAVTCSYW